MIPDSEIRILAWITLVCGVGFGAFALAYIPGPPAAVILAASLILVVSAWGLHGVADAD